MSEPDPYTPYCDVYSFGVVIYELISGQLPYSNMHERDLVSLYTHMYKYAWFSVHILSLSLSLSLKILFMVGRGLVRPDPSHARKDTPKAFKQLLIKCCDFNKEQRPLFPQVRLIAGHYSKQYCC